MSDTAIVALITFASGAVGALAGLIATVVSAHINQKSQMDEIVVKECFKTRMDVYMEFLEISSKITLNDIGEVKFFETISCINRAFLVASPITALSLIRYQDILNSMYKGKEWTCENKKAYDLSYTDVCTNMQNDLSTFYRPDVKKFPNFHSRRARQDMQKAIQREYR